MAAGGLGTWIGQVGKDLGLPEFGVSEFLAGAGLLNNQYGSGRDLGYRTPVVDRSAASPKQYNVAVPINVPARATRNVPSVLGAQATQSNPNYDTSLDYLTGGGSSGGGGGSAGLSTSQINANLEAMKAIIEGRYNDAVTALTNSAEAMKTNVANTKQNIQGFQSSNIESIQRGAQNTRSMARQDYQDALLQARRRAVASGAGSGSGYLDITGKLDQALMRTMSDVNFQEMNNIQKVNLTAQEAINSLENDLAEKLNAIEKEKAMTARDKEQAVLEAQINAANQALEVQSWAINRASGWGGSPINNNQAAAAAWAQAQQKIAEISSMPYSQAVKDRMINEVNNNLNAIGLATGKYNPWTAKTSSNPTMEDMIWGKINAGTTDDEMNNLLNYYQKIYGK